MIPTVRMYETELAARQAANELHQNGFAEDSIALLVAPNDGEGEVRTAVDAGQLPGSHAALSARALQRGRSVVSVNAPFGRGAFALEILDRFSPVDTDQLPDYYPRHGDLLSQVLSLPTLTGDRYVPWREPKRSKFRFSKWLLGMPLLTSSSLQVLPGKTILSSRGPWRRSFGMPLLTSSSLQVLPGKAIISSRGPWTRSFGMPLLSRNPAPLSSMLGMPLLTGEDDD